tara:strand:- start:372 stop:521 length:150 start_codon:yes stop_codon:yes gene_type:complete
MNKILFLSLALFVAETVSAEEGLQPYLFLVTIEKGFFCHPVLVLGNLNL